MNKAVATTLADDAAKLLDNGWRIVMFRNSELGSYTAKARKPGRATVTTDDFTPSKALYRLVEKATTGRVA